MLRHGTPVVAVLAAVALPGCYGSTEPATDVRFDSATLHARGTADDGQANSFFEYWVDGHPERVRRSPAILWPAGASGPLAERVDGLYPRTTYRFRLCGFDAGRPPAVCAQTRSFATTAPTADAVRGSWTKFDSPFSPSGDIRATAGAPGQPPTGRVGYYPGSDLPSFEGFVTCLVVGDRRAAVGAVGRTVAFSGVTAPATVLVTVVQNEPERDDLVRAELRPGATPPSCAAASALADSDAVGTDDLVVYDAPG